MKQFNDVKVFSATMVRDREVLGEKVTDWITTHQGHEITDVIVTQSSDNEFHCVTITLFFNDPNAVVRVASPTKTAARR